LSLLLGANAGLRDCPPVCNGAVLYPSLDYENHSQKDGEMLPGKKGISLMPDQFQRLQDDAATVSAALNNNDDDFELDLSDKYVAPTLHCC
jgi:hypothetical protein